MVRSLFPPSAVDFFEVLTQDEIAEVTKHTIRKIQCYPKEQGKTLENYFDVLFPYELSDYVMRRNINQKNAANYDRRLSNVQ